MGTKCFLYPMPFCSPYYYTVCLGFRFRLALVFFHVSFWLLAQGLKKLVFTLWKTLVENPRVTIFHTPCKSRAVLCPFALIHSRTSIITALTVTLMLAPTVPVVNKYIN